MSNQIESMNDLWVASCLFGATAALATLKGRRKREKKAQSRQIAEASLSERGRKALSPPIPYLNQFLACLQVRNTDICSKISQNPQDPHSEANPRGHVALCVAENKLITQALAQRCSQQAPSAFLDLDSYCYNSFVGSPSAREAVAYFLSQHFGSTDAKHVGLSAGAAPLLSHLFTALGSAGQACLIPAPYYAAFENDMGVLAGIIPVAVYQAKPVEGPSNEELEKVYNATSSSGTTPRFLLLTNPHNPMGTIYQPSTLRRLVAWARSKGMHVIVDEIYALSTHSVRVCEYSKTVTHHPQGHKFESIISALNNDLRNDVHMIWALSKDFGASGLRVGVVVSHNLQFMEALATLNIFSCVSGPIQYLMAELLTDSMFCDTLLQTSRQRLWASYQICEQKLQEMVLPYVPAVAGMFVYVDFSSLLPEATPVWEETFSNLVFVHARIVMTPGNSQKDSRPGFFRICYAWVTPSQLAIAMERLSRLVGKVRRLDWDDLNERTLSHVLDVE